MNRTEIISSIISKYHYDTYLEIGVKNPKNNFDKIRVSTKYGVDPNWKSEPGAGKKFEMTSDDFFKTLDSTIKFDIIFIDGLHHHEQIFKDFINATTHLNNNGTIIFHDCNPTNKSMQECPRTTSKQWTGDAWKTIFKIRSLMNEQYKLFTVDCDFGCCIAQIGKDEVLNFDYNINADWNFFNTNRKKILNLISVQEFEKWLKN